MLRGLLEFCGLVEVRFGGCRVWSAFFGYFALYFAPHKDSPRRKSNFDFVRIRPPCRGECSGGRLFFKRLGPGSFSSVVRVPVCDYFRNILSPLSGKLNALPGWKFPAQLKFLTLGKTNNRMFYEKIANLFVRRVLFCRLFFW